MPGSPSAPNFMTLRALILPSLFLAALGQSAYCIITINNDSASLSAPSNGAPWDYVARLDDGFGARASGVYLGNRYVITANHVDNDINLVHLDNTDFTLDSSFTPLAIAGTDMRILRLAQDPGLPMLPLITSSENAFNQAATMIGWGVGKGTVVPNQGWNWGDDTTRLERWGTSTTLGSYMTDPNSGFTYLQTTFDITKGAATGQLTGGDSGGGLFVNFGGVWTLAGINADVDTDNQALYDHDLSTAGNQPDHSYFASVTQFTNQIDSIIGAAPIGGLVQYWDGAGPANNGTIEGGPGTWNATGLNWTNSGGTINTKWQSGTAVFGGTSGTVTLTSAISAQGLTFNSTGYTIAGTSTLTLTGSAPEIDVTNAGNSATISAKLAGTAGLKVGGAGTLILTNPANTYTGATQVGVGTLQIGTTVAASKIVATSAVTLSQGGALSLVNVGGGTFANNVTTGAGGGTLTLGSANTTTVSGTLTDNGTDQLSVLQSGTGTSILTNAHNTYSGSTTISGGTLQIGTTTAAGSIGANSAINFSNNGTLLLVNVAGNTLGNNINDLSPGTAVVNVNSTSTLTLSGTISNASGLVSVAKNNTGTLVISNPANTYGGGTTLNSGTLIANGSTADGSGSPLGTGTLTINGGTLGTTVEPTSGSSGTTLANAIALHGNFSVATNVDAANAGAQNLTLNGPIALNGVTRTITGVTNAGQVHFGSGGIGVVGETAGVNFNTSFSKAGSYVAFIFDPGNVNNYTGQTTVNNGAFLVFEGSTADGAIRGNLDIEGNGSVDYINGSSSASQIADTATVTVNSTGNTLGSSHFDGLEMRGASDTIGTLNGKGSVGLGSGTLTIGAGNFTGIIENGAFGAGGSLVKNTGGTLILSGKNTYGGQTVVNGGTLQAGAVNTLPSTSPLTVAGGGTFDLHGFSQNIAAIFGSGNVTLGSATLTLGATNISSTFTGSISGTGGLTKVGPGTFALTGTNTYSGPTNVTSGAFILAPTGTTPVLSSSSALAVGGNANGSGAFALDGISGTPITQVLNGLTVNAGQNILAINTPAGTTTTLDLRGLSGTAGITRNANGFVDFEAINGGTLGVDAVFLTSQANDASGILGGWATINGGSDYATNVGGKIVGLASIAGGYTTIGAIFDTVPNGSNLHVLINSAVGLGNTANDVIAAHPLTSIDTLTQNFGTASTIDLQGGTLQLGSDGGLLITPNGANLTIGVAANNGVLTAAKVSNSSNSITISSNSQLGTPGILTVNSAIQDNGTTRVAVRFTGNGATVFAGTNTYTGSTYILSGTLQTNADHALGNNSALILNSVGTLNLNGHAEAVGSISDGPKGGGTIALGGGALTTGGDNTSTAFSGAITGAGSLTKVGTGTFTFAGNSTYTGGTTLSNGGLIINSSTALGSGLLTIAPTGSNKVALGSTVGNTAVSSAVSAQGNFSVSTAGLGQNFFLNGNVDLTGGTRIITGVTDGGQVQFGGSISNGGVTFNTAFTKTGDYVAFIYGGANTYTGQTTVNNGAILVFEGTTADGGIRGNLDIEGNGSVDYIAGSSSASQIADTATVTVNSTGNAVSGTHFDGLELRGASDTIGTLKGKGTIGLGSGVLTVEAGNFTGVIEDGAFGTGGSLAMNNANSTFIMSGKNTYTGYTAVGAGTLQAGAAGTMPTMSLVGVAAGATLDLHNFNQSVGSLTNVNSSGGTINLGSATLTIGNDGRSAPFSGVIQGTGGLTKVGTGTQELVAGQTYSGMTNVNGGTLQIDNSLVSATVNVGTAGTLAGAGTIHGKTTLTGNGTINLSNGTLGSTLAITGGNWTGIGTVNGVATSSSGTFTIGSGATLTGNAGINVTGGKLAGTGNLAANLKYTSAVSSTFGGVIQDGSAASSVTMSNASATLTLTGVNTYSGPTTITAGTLQVGDGNTGGLTGAGPVNVSGTGSLATSLAYQGSFSQNIFLNGTGTSFKSLSTSYNEVTGVISGTGSVNQNGTGITSLKGTNTYTGATNINSGILSVDGSLAAASTVNVRTGGTLLGVGTINGNATLTGNGTIYLDNSGLIGGTLAVTGGNWAGTGTVNGRVTSSTGTFNITGGATLTANSGVNVTGGALGGTGTIDGSLTYASSVSGTFAGEITGANSVVTMNHASTTLTLTGANAYGGGTTISAGTLQVGDGVDLGATLGSGVVTTATAGTLTTNLASNETFSNSVADNGHVIATGTTNNYTIASAISGTGNLTKNGTNTVTLTGNSTYKGGTIVNAGTLLVNNLTGSGTGTGTVAINKGATLGGVGTVGPVTLNSGGILAPSAGTPGVSGSALLATSLMWNGGGTLKLQLGAPGDELVLTGALTKGSAGTYAIDILDAGLTQTSYPLVTFASTTFSSFDFTLNMPSGDTGVLVESGTSLTLQVLTVGGSPSHAELPASTSSEFSISDTQSGQLAFASDSGTSSSPTMTTSFVATPEPGGIALLAVGSLPFFGKRRRRAR